MSRATSAQDIVIVGGGHNGLVAATYLAQAGKSVTVLERLDHLGGAAVSAQVFEGVDARLSRYSYLVSLLPARIIRDLGLGFDLTQRRYSSYTPLPGTDRGLLVDNGDASSTAKSFESIGAGADAAAWGEFYGGTARLARSLFPTVCDPLLTRGEARRLVGDDRLWSAIVEEPIGRHIESSFGNDLVRGVALTDALIGTFAPAEDETLSANRCFLYHVIGNGTGDWDVPVGGMGAVSGALERAARKAGATIVTSAEVTAVTADGEVTYRFGGAEATIAAGTVLAGVAPHVLERLLNGSSDSPARPEGAQVKVNLLLKRLPRLRDDAIDPAAAFGGTFHINETYSQLDRAYGAAFSGVIPDPLPAEVYCHSLTDPSILSPELAESGAHTLTVFGLHVPDRLLTATNNDQMRDRLQQAALDSLNSVLAEPVESLLMTDAAGFPTIETKTTLDLEHALHMPGGNIFHGPLAWPFAEDDVALATPAERWGVATAHKRILLCGAGAQRGGGVSGIGGHNAAMAVLERG
ncbi:MAG: NAD(P)/FAD-dependent oxidoreductase [Microbacteriaceae bacterium]|jgi:phytoene dehydrogenase-like protein|nr:NAD(P)/FAD-dependent oxidoreductase [Microbacteriaceae bacterium]